MTDYLYTHPSGDSVRIGSLSLLAYDATTGRDAGASLPGDTAERVEMARAILQGTGATVTAPGEPDRYRTAWSSARQRAAEWRHEAKLRFTTVVHECCEQHQAAVEADTAEPGDEVPDLAELHGLVQGLVTTVEHSLRPAHQALSARVEALSRRVDDAADGA